MKATFHGPDYWLQGAWQDIADSRSIARPKLEERLKFWTSSTPPEHGYAVWARESTGIGYADELARARAQVHSHCLQAVVVHRVPTAAHENGIHLVVERTRDKIFHTHREAVLYLLKTLGVM